MARNASTAWILSMAEDIFTFKVNYERNTAIKRLSDYDRLRTSLSRKAREPFFKQKFAGLATMHLGGEERRQAHRPLGRAGFDILGHEREPDLLTC